MVAWRRQIEPIITRFPETKQLNVPSEGHEVTFRLSFGGRAEFTLRKKIHLVYWALSVG